MWIVGLFRLCSFLCDVLITRRAKTTSERGWTCSRSGRSARRAGVGEARFVILQDSHIDLVLFVGFLIALCEQAIITAAGRRLRRRQASNAAGAHVQSNFMSCPRLSQDLFFCMRYVRKRSLFSFAGVSNNQTNSLEVSVGSIAFVFVVHSMAFFPLPCEAICVLMFDRCMVLLIVAITGAHRAPDRPLAAAVALWPADPGADRGCASATRSRRKSWRLLLVRSSATLVQASGDSTGGRAQILS